MANTFLTPDLIARQAYANLYAQTVMAQLVHRDYEGEFRGKQGDTVTIRKPASFTAEEFVRVDGITVQDGTEAGIPVVLDTLLDVSFAVTAEELTLDLVDFNEQLLSPATEAIAQGIDTRVLALRTDVVQTDEWANAGTPDGSILIDAGETLNEQNVPQAGRHVAAGTGLTANLLRDPLFHQADQRGDTEGLREASIGRKFGFDNWMTQNVTDGVSVAFHESAFALVSRTLALPRGNSNAAVFSGRGFGLRIVQDYDIDKKQDVISVDVLIGVKTLDANRATLLQEAAA